MNRLRPGKSSGKLDYIDALRGIAALSIFFYHIYGTTGSLTKGAYPIEILPERFIGLTLVGIPLFLSSVLSLYACLWTARPVRAIGLSSSIFAGYSE
jgi:peptidoglycan/LPS O-acetylase OafA/YrhL